MRDGPPRYPRRDAYDDGGRGPQRGPQRGGPRRGPPPGRPGGRPGGYGPPRRPTLPAGFELVYGRGSLLAISKPAGVPLRGPRGTKCARNVAERFARESLRPLNAIDDASSGVCLFVAGDHPPPGLLMSVRPNRAPRQWIAIVEGGPSEDEGTVRTPLRAGEGGLAEPVPRGPGIALPTDEERATTHYQVVHRGGGLALLRLRCETDLPQQVRAHLKELGCPVLGDHAFGATRDDLDRLALHLHEIVIENRTGPRTRLTAAAPAAFYSLVGAPVPAKAEAAKPNVRTDEGWSHVAAWYDDLLEHRGSDHHDEVIYPGVMSLLGEGVRGGRVLDLACGQGAFGRELLRSAFAPYEVVGVDAAEPLVQLARGVASESERYEVGDASALGDLDLGPFDAATCILALMNIEDLEGVASGVADSLRPGGRFVAVVLHPAFRIPRSSSWAWQDPPGVQFRRIDRYMGEHAVAIRMNPGEQDAEAIETVTHHRPSGGYVGAFAEAGRVLTAMEEWTSTRISEPGPRAEEENRMRSEIPMFLALRFESRPAEPRR